MIYFSSISPRDFFLVFQIFSSIVESRKISRRQVFMGPCGLCSFGSPAPMAPLAPPSYANPCFTGQPILSSAGIPQFCNWQMPSACPATYFCHIGAVPQTTCCCPNVNDDPCSQPLNIGQGTAALRRFYFNRASGYCEEFYYHGTLGNQNNFISIETCQKSCGSNDSPPKFPNPCRGQTGAAPYRCSASTPNACPAGFWCHIGAIAETTVCCSGSGEQCTAMKQTGDGGYSLQRWWFNQVAQQCEPFIYSGSGGTQNNHLTKEQCEQSCPIWINPCQMAIPGNPLFNCTAVNLDSCPASTWCHVGSDYRTTVCCPNAVGDFCALPKSDGIGTAALTRWYFDQNNRQCMPFTYRGLQGNQNNFLSQHSCEESCPTWNNVCPQGMPIMQGSKPQSCSVNQPCPTDYWCHIGSTESSTMCCRSTGPICQLPRSPGQGQSSIQRWFYDAQQHLCLQFTYMGTKGNENNFLSESDCAALCPVYINACPLGNPTMDAMGRPQYCSPAERCPMNYWCHVGANKRSTMCCPAVGDPCKQPKLSGDGTFTLPRFAYDSLRHDCVPFTYRGLKGNQNNFLTLADCAQICPVFSNPCPAPQPLLGTDRLPVNCQHQLCPTGYWCHFGISSQSTVCCPGVCDPCTSPMNLGQGHSSLQRWYFNSVLGRCEQFIYAGEMGNCNNFLSKPDCQYACPEVNACKPPDQPLMTNQALVSCSRDSTASCPPTHYCHVGENLLTTVCCPRRTDPCHEPPDFGIGNANLIRYHYNGDQDECLPFSYRGLQGNSNNFLSIMECETVCPGLRGYCPHGRPLVIAEEPQECNVQTLCQPNYICHVNTQYSISVCCADPSYFCFLPIEIGNCNSTMTRYAYNPATDTCKPFTWSGCGGNLNNFASLETCTQICCNDPNVKYFYSEWLMNRD